MNLQNKNTHLFALLISATCFIYNVNGQDIETVKQVPYADIIEDARIETNSLQSPTMEALIQGNGDIHSLVYAQGKQIILRLAKNDVYDARIETADDLELAKIDIVTGKTSRKLTLPPSWDKPYPLSINFANLTIDYSGSENAVIDILHSNTNINNDEIVIRPLLQDNVYHIQTKQKVTLSGKAWHPIPAAEMGETDNVKWVKQVLPADVSGDWKGMHVVTAMASKGANHFVAVVTSLENENPMDAAIELAKSYVQKEISTVVEEHENLWLKFWQASGVKLSHKTFNDIWYQNLYFSRCAQNPNSQAIGLFIGPLLNPPEGWHDNYTINYNFQQTFWSFFNTNHVEYVNPYNKVVLDYLPRAQWFAKQTYGIEGAFYPHNLYRHEPVNPEECKSNNNRMFSGGPWAYTLGLSSFLMHNLWLSYKFYPEQERLQEIYPVIREMARFYVNFCEKCEISKDGKLRLGPTVSPEHMPFGVYNCPFDIAFMKFSFRGFIEASGKLNQDQELAIEAEKYMKMLPNYPVQQSSGFVVDREKGEPLEYNIPVPITPIFPAEQVTFFSSSEEKKLFAHTLKHIKTNENNSTIMLAVSKARLSTPDAKSWLEEALRVRRKPNGSIRFSTWEHFDGYGHYTEMFASTGAITELLLQSVDNIIRVFPAWPKEEDAEFTTLRTRGGFLVSAKLKNGVVSEIEIVSEFGGQFSFVSPWEKVKIRNEKSGRTKEIEIDDSGIASFETNSANIYIISEAK